MTTSRFRLPMWALFRIAERDDWTCHICTQKYMATETWEIDHDIARAKFGTEYLKNLRLAHKTCNREKSDA